MPADYRGNFGSRRVGVIPFMGESLSVVETEPNAILDSLTRLQPDEESTIGGVTEADGTGDSLLDFGAEAGPDFQAPQTAMDPRDTIMHVRSGVTSYWRVQLYDFDGQRWFRSRSRIVERALPKRRDYYWQAYFLQQDQPGAIFTGYNAIRVIVPGDVRDRGGLVEGSTYSVLSQRPELGSSAVRSDTAGRLRGRYLDLPQSWEPVRDVARSMVGDSVTPFQKPWFIVSYLRQRYTYDASAPDQLRLSGSTEEFLAGQGSGTSMDFAAATVLLARAVGLPARIAIGYLPGRFDPFSGTHKVRRRDSHAWAEVNFRRSGWVAFDATPRPELERFIAGDPMGFGGTFIFQTRVGGGLYRVLQSGASEAADRIAGILEGRRGLIGPAVGIIAALTLLSVVTWVLLNRSRGRRERWPYSRLAGEGRREILKNYTRMERLLRRRGLERRRRSQTLGDYAEAAARMFVDARDVERLTRAALAAAYDPIPPDPKLSLQIAACLSRLRRGSALRRET